MFEMARAWLRPAQGESDRQSRSMLVCLAIASIPALITGFFLHDLVEFYLRDMRIIAWTTIGFGLILWFADAVGSRSRAIGQITRSSALVIGLAQASALIPGASRSGVTITAARFLGYTPDAAARFSFLLAIPVVAAAGGYGAWRVATGEARIDWVEFTLAMSLAAVAGWLCIAAFLALLKRTGLMPFVVYRLLLGLFLLWLLS